MSKARPGDPLPPGRHPRCEGLWPAARMGCATLAFNTAQA